MSDRDPKEAKSALEEDPAARRVAEEIRLGAVFYRMSLAQARREGFEEGFKEGFEEGLEEVRQERRDQTRAEVVRDAVKRISPKLGIEVTEDRKQMLDAATADQAQAILNHISLHRKWPD